MDSQIKSAIIAACFSLFVIFGAAHDGHDHTPGMTMSPAPAPSHIPSQSSFTYPSILFVIIALNVSFFAFTKRV